METSNVLIIGGACAGLTAALYSARANLEPLVVEGVAPMGQLMLTTEVENYPGFPDGIQGPDLMLRMHEQAERFGAKFISADATKVDLSSRPFVVEVGEATYPTRTIIVATGATPRLLGISGERQFLGHGVSTCATCDGFFFNGQPLVVVGGGDCAMEDATFLTRYATKVTVVHRREQLRASKVMQERAFANPKIDFRWHTVVEEVRGSDGRVESVLLKDVATGERTDFPVPGVFVAIGHDPNTTLFRGQLAMDRNAYIVVDHPRTWTSVDGVFACGDAVDHVYRQAITAAGTGCAAAIDAERYIEAEGR